MWSVENKYYRTKILIQYACFDETGEVNVEIDKCEALVLIVNWSQELNVCCESGVAMILFFATGQRRFFGQTLGQYYMST